LRDAAWRFWYVALMRTLIFFLLGVLAGTARAHPPAVGPAELFASGLAGPEGIAFTKGGDLLAGSVTGEIRRYAADGSFTVLANVGESLAGITVLGDGRVLAAAFAGSRVWSIDPSGAASVFATGVPGPNFIVQLRSGRILVSDSSSGTIVEITDGSPVVRASGLTYPNGLAIGPHHFLYVAETFANRVSRLAIGKDGTLGPPEVYATGLSIPDGIAFDVEGNLLVVGALPSVVDAKTQAVSTLPTGGLLEFSSNLAFGRGHGFRQKDVYLVDYGAPLGSGTTIVRLPYNHRGAKLIR
jgi:gluconolactonase